MNVVHIGFPKTGTTFLQWNVFPYLDGCNFIDYHQCHATFMELIYLDDLDYDHAQIHKLLKKLLKEGNNLASYEALTGAPFTFKGLNRSNIPDRLRALGFDKIIITTRDQTEVIDSLYRQYVVQGGVMRFRDFLNLDGKWNPYLRAFNLDYLRYDRLIKRYIDRFGKDNVLVLPLEKLKGHADDYYNSLSDFLSTEVIRPKSKKANPALSNLAISLLRVINHFTFNSQRPNQLISNRISSKNFWKLFAVVLDPYLFRLFSSRKSFLKGSDREVIRSYYQAGNEELKRMLS